ATAAVANAPAQKAAVVAPRGMGARGIGRGGMGAKSGPPANLLTVGVVPKAASAQAPSAAPTNTAKAPDDAEAVAIIENAEALPAAPAKSGRKRPAAKKAAARKKEAAPAAASTPAAKRGGRKKPAAKAAAGTAAE
ncbi:MAG TPA: hypothetical protein VKO87_06305, partial [Gemmatimonadaceae bacterium]|nr:hypothetical protein [Gemmatimonadaceae bacterium]